jgi:hypothetical protein
VLYERIRPAGGLLYPVIAFAMSRNNWTDHFGTKWSLLHDTRPRCDPLGTLTPGYNVFCSGVTRSASAAARQSGETALADQIRPDTGAARAARDIPRIVLFSD